jgi:hypothetical protein
MTSFPTVMSAWDVNRGYVYFTPRSRDRLFKASLADIAGTAKQIAFFGAGNVVPHNYEGSPLAIDTKNGKIYVCTLQYLFRCNLDGSSPGT